jgi:8-amino-7-oxononanoate synthase
MDRKFGNFFEKEFQNLAGAGLLRKMRTVTEMRGKTVAADGREYLAFASNDYLGLARDPRLAEGAKKAIKEFGAGSTASRLVAGNLEIHEELERRTARFKNREACLVYPSGFQANIGLFPTLFDENDIIVSDSHNHASMIAGIQLSKARVEIYPHLDMGALERTLDTLPPRRMCVIATESVFSMEGDVAPLDDIARLAKHYGAITMIDEAHATGVMGEGGRGCEAAFENIAEPVDIVMGTYSKALGSQGGFICGGKDLIKYLYNSSRAFLYTTGLAPAACGAAIAAIDVIENDPMPLKRLRAAIATCRAKLKENGFEPPPHETPIIPVTIGAEEAAVKAGDFLLEKGILAPVMRYPTVERGRAIIRVSVSAPHEEEDFDRLVGALVEARDRFDFGLRISDYGLEESN